MWRSCSSILSNTSLLQLAKKTVRTTMMFPCSALPPPLFPAILRPPASLSSPLTRSIPSGFLMEDILRLSHPVSYIHRALCPRSPDDILPLSTGPGGCDRTLGPSTGRTVLPSSNHPSRPGSSQTACPDSGLKFGVSAILAPSTRSGEWIKNYTMELVLYYSYP